MKQWYLWMFAPLALFVVISCSKDSEETSQKQIIDTNLFLGEWCSIDPTNKTVTVLNFNQYKFTGSIYQNTASTPSVYEQLTGSWLFYSTNNVLKTTVTHSANGIQEDVLYTVLQLTENTMRLREQSVGVEDIYYRIVQNKQVIAGSEFSLELSTNAISYASTNATIASVDAKGRVATHMAGIAFITASSETGTVVAKVEVSSRVETFMSELSLSINDIQVLHGNPTSVGNTDDMSFLLYSNPTFDNNLNDVTYVYFEGETSIAFISTTYNKMVDWTNDVNEVKKNYIDTGDDLYGSNPDWMKNKYLISPSDGVTEYSITYLNTAIAFK